MIVRNGLTLRVDRKAEGPSPLLRFKKSNSDRMTSDVDPSTITPPEGIRVEWVDHEADRPELEPPLPDLVPSFLLSRRTGDDSVDWFEASPGVLYQRELILGYLGGRYICAHMKILVSKVQPGYVHHHHCNFQVLYCFKGWVDVVYEDQGPPFRMVAGDCTLQPPHIRHQVLECSPGVEVLDLTSPALNNLIGELELTLPNAVLRPDRLFSGQRFSRYQGKQAQWQPMETTPNWEQSDTGFDIASGGVGGAKFVRPLESASDTELDLKSSSEFVFRFVIRGSVDLQYEEEAGSMAKQRLGEGDSFVIPQKMSAKLANAGAGTEILEISSPA